MYDSRFEILIVLYMTVFEIKNLCCAHTRCIDSQIMYPAVCPCGFPHIKALICSKKPAYTGCTGAPFVYKLLFTVITLFAVYSSLKPIIYTGNISKLYGESIRHRRNLID